MSGFSIVHVLAALVALGIACTIVAMPKGTRRHRVLGWTYVVLMLLGLVAIGIAGRDDLSPFHGYALVVALAVTGAILASRLRHRLTGWRAWHAALLSFSILAACVATGGVLGGVALGLGNGPDYFAMFNIVIALVTALGLWLIVTRPVIWSTKPTAQHRAIRLRFSVGVIAVSAGLILSQWVLFQ